MTKEKLDHQELKYLGIYPVTESLSFGKFPDKKMRDQLIALGVTHVLNVSGIYRDEDNDSRFSEMLSYPVTDLQLLALEDVAKLLKLVLQVYEVPGSHLYIHCSAGQNRSPSVAWLWLVCCGIEEDLATQWLENNSLDAIAPHPRIIDDRHKEFCRANSLGKSIAKRRGEIISAIE